MTTVIEHTQGSYEVQDVQFGKVYKWRPEKVVVWCECGERATLTGLKTTCGWCGANHAAPVQEVFDAWQLKYEAARPWRHAGDREDAGFPTSAVQVHIAPVGRRRPTE